MSFWKKPLETPENAKENMVFSSSFDIKPAVDLARPSTAESSSNTQADLDPLSKRYGKARSALGAGTVIQGKLSFDTPVRIDGKLGGEIFSSEALIVGPTGTIDAQVEVRALVVQGVVKGRIVAKERIEILAGGRVEGTITTPNLVIEETAVYNGKCTMEAMQNQMAPTRIISIEESPKAASAPERNSNKDNKDSAKDRESNKDTEKGTSTGTQLGLH